MPIQLLASPKIGPFISAHRGFSSDYPENTIPALQAALDTGAHVAEIDVRLTQDGKLVLMHDAKVDRTTDGSGPVTAMTLAEVKKLDAGRWFDRKFAATKVPTLDEVLDWSNCATASTFFPFRVTVTRLGAAGKSRSHRSCFTP